MLRRISLQAVYKSDLDNILEDFYIPALFAADRYDRAVGYFSASTISYAAQALSVFVKNGGRVRLILGAFTDEQDLEAITQGYREKEISDKIGEELLAKMANVSDELFQNRFETLAWLVAYGRLEVKIALRAQGMFHDKIGIISDSENDRVVFSGSANESTHALLPTYNYESINVFPSWRPELADYVKPHIESFERLWRNESRATAVIDVPTAVQERLIRIGRALDYTPDPEIEAAIAARVRAKVGGVTSTVTAKPQLPKTIGSQPFKMRDHQRDALNAWRAKGDFQGVFDLATGAGKTITSIYGIVKMAEEIDGLACVIAVPYQNLADQWVDILSVFNVFPVRCYVSRAQWEDKLQTVVHELVMGSRKFAAIVVVNRTLKSPEFQTALKKINGSRLLWIGDECHHHTSAAYNGFLPAHARYRIGLSATPEHYMDVERNERLNRYYGEIVYSYALKQAIEDKVLTPYRYFPHVVRLTATEAEDFISLSEQIGRLAARQRSANATATSTQLTALTMRRARLVGSAAGKQPALSEVIAACDPTQHTLFYCGDGSVETDDDDDGGSSAQRQIEAVSELLHEKGWDVSRFTSRESRKERDSILENFRLGIIDAMVAIRCLDEGIDVPACSTAYILASSRDPRQFVVSARLKPPA